MPEVRLIFKSSNFSLLPCVWAFSTYAQEVLNWETKKTYVEEYLEILYRQKKYIEY